MEMTATGADASVARLKGYLERDPENWGLRARLFDALLASGDREGARAQLSHALERLPGDPAWLHRQAMLFLAEGRYADAQGVLEGLLVMGTDFPAIRYNLGWALFFLERWEDASAALAPLLESADEGAAGVPALWLRCQHRLDHPEEALATFKRLEATRPLNAEAQGVASLLFLDEGEFVDARRLSEAALRQRPDQLEALATRGTVFLADQDAAAALEWFGRALRVNPEDGRCWAGLAAARMLAMDFQGAREAFASAVQRIPGHQGTWIGYGWCLLLARDFLGAKAAFERAVEVDRNIAEAHGGLAVALARLGEVDAAKTEIEVANRLDKANLSSHYAQAVLSGLADDPERFKQFAARVLKGRPGIEGIAGGASLAELVMGRPGRSRPPARTPNPKA